jgi:hypothetical protein
MMKKLKHLSIVLLISLLLSTVSYAGDMHSDSTTGAPAQSNTEPQPVGTSDPNADDADKAEAVAHLELILNTLHTLLNIF